MMMIQQIDRNKRETTRPLIPRLETNHRWKKKARAPVNERKSIWTAPSPVVLHFQVHDGFFACFQNKSHPSPPPSAPQAVRHKAPAPCIVLPRRMEYIIPRTASPSCCLAGAAGQFDRILRRPRDLDVPVPTPNLKSIMAMGTCRLIVSTARSGGLVHPWHSDCQTRSTIIMHETVERDFQDTMASSQADNPR